MSSRCIQGTWSDKKRLAAEAMAEGTEVQADIAERLKIRPETISRWKRDVEFIKRIDEITLSLERHTLAGMLRRLDGQQEHTVVKRTEWTKLEEMKYKLLGLDKLKTEHSGTVEIKSVVVYLPDNNRDPVDIPVPSDPVEIPETNDHNE